MDGLTKFISFLQGAYVQLPCYPRHAVIPPEVWCFRYSFGGPNAFLAGVWMSRVSFVDVSYGIISLLEMGFEAEKRKTITEGVGSFLGSDGPNDNAANGEVVMGIRTGAMVI